MIDRARLFVLNTIGMCWLAQELGIVPSLRHSDFLLPSRHCRAGLQTVTSLRDWLGE